MIKTIPLEAVRSALMCAVIKKKTKGIEASGKPHARTAAFTNYPKFLANRRDLKRSSGMRVQPEVAVNFGLMNHGDLNRLADEVHLFQPSGEVRKIWGCGIRALQTELKESMR